MKTISTISLLVVIISACITAAFVSILEPVGFGAFALLLAWLVSPHVALAALLISVRQRHNESFSSLIVSVSIVAMLTSIGGILLIASVMWWSPDAQGAIGVVLTPVWQAIGIVLCVVLVACDSESGRKWLNRASGSGRVVRAESSKPQN